MFITVEEADFQKIVETWNQGFSDYLIPVHVDEKGLADRIQSLKLSKKLSAVFSIDGEYAGIILLGTQTFQEIKVMWVGGMAVIPKYRRNKVASKLMDYAEKVARVNQCDYLILEVIATNERARNLYQEKGFQAVNELAVGTLDLPDRMRSKKGIHFKAISPAEQALNEKKWTPWQNRCIFSDKNYDIYQENTKIGSISFDLVKEPSDKTLILKQLHLFKPNKRIVLEDIFYVLKEQDVFDTIKLMNIDMSTPEYSELKQIGVRLQFTQFQLAKKIVQYD